MRTNFRDSKDSMGGLGPETSHWPAGSKRDGVQEHPSPQAPGGGSHSHLSHPGGDNGIRACGLLQITKVLTPSWGMGRGGRSGGSEAEAGGGVGAGLPCTIHGGSQSQQGQ